jgi:DNA recombination protein RmuC
MFAASQPLHGARAISMIDFPVVGAVLAALTFGGIVAWFLARARYTARSAQQLAELTAQLAAKHSRIDEWEQSDRRVQEEIAHLRADLMTRAAELAAAQASLEAANAQGQEKLELLLAARKELSDQFRVLATEIMDEKSKRFVELNEAALTQLLTPLRGELTGFREKVEEIYVADVAGRSALGEQVRMLTELNGAIRKETTDLTKALKGDAKAQGNWGEVILERLLESAGLIEGEHYRRQESHRDDDGKRVIPDVVIDLPDDRHLVVDSKVTLTAYSEFAAATADDARAAALKAHLEAVRRHIKGLSEKKYQTLYSLTSLDFVVMFMPLEGAFMTAVTSDEELFQYAWAQNVLLVSPSTLLFVVRTIAHVWGQEKQKRNFQDIAKRGATLYDKFVGFGVDLLKVGEHLTKARDSFDDARRKLSEGSGNLVRQAEMLKKLGVRPSKTMPTELTASLDDMIEDEEDAVAAPLPLIAPTSSTIQPS